MHSLTSRNPFPDRWFDAFSGGMSEESGFLPAIDVYQTQAAVVVEAPLAGVDPKDVRIAIENDVLTMEGKKEHKSEVEEKDYYRKEVRFGAFHRAIPLPASSAAEAAKAVFEKGVLRITIPKQEHTKPKSIEIEVKEQ